MPSEQSVPTEIIEVIVQALAVDRDRHPSANDAALRAFYRPATHALFRTVSLQMYPYTPIEIYTTRNGAMQRFRAITRANTSLLAMIHNLSINLNIDCATVEENEEIWTSLEDIALHSANLQSVSIVGNHAGSPWWWMQCIEDDAHKMPLCLEVKGTFSGLT